MCRKHFTVTQGTEPVVVFLPVCRTWANLWLKSSVAGSRSLTPEESCPAEGFKVPCGEIVRPPGARADKSLQPFICEHSLTLLCISSWFSQVLPTLHTQDWNGTTPVPVPSVTHCLATNGVSLFILFFFHYHLFSLYLRIRPILLKAQQQIKT